MNFLKLRNDMRRTNSLEGNFLNFYGIKQTKKQKIINKYQFFLQGKQYVEFEIIRWLKVIHYPHVMTNAVGSKLLNLRYLQIMSSEFYKGWRLSSNDPHWWSTFVLAKFYREFSRARFCDKHKTMTKWQFRLNIREIESTSYLSFCVAFGL
jgi:hypothetical protein